MGPLFSFQGGDAMTSSASVPKIAPGPPCHPIVGHLPELSHDPLRFLLRVRREYGDVVRLQIGPALGHLVSHPDWIHYVLAAHHENYHKSPDYRAIQPLVGKGLVTSEDDLWRRQRQLIQPAFHLDCLKAFGPLIVETTQGMLDRWQSYLASGEPFDVAEEMSRSR
jgi:cytochrome P450